MRVVQHNKFCPDNRHDLARIVLGLRSHAKKANIRLIHKSVTKYGTVDIRPSTTLTENIPITFVFDSLTIDGVAYIIRKKHNNEYVFTIHKDTPAFRVVHGGGKPIARQTTHRVKTHYRFTGDTDTWEIEIS